MSPDAFPGSGHLLIHDYSGHAFTAQLARQMARRGHRTTYLSFADFSTPKGRVESRAADPPLFEARPLTIGRRARKHRLLMRACDDYLYARRLVPQVLAARPTTVISANAPPLVQAALLRACRRVGAKFVFWMQDVYSEAIPRIVGRRHPRLGAILRRYLHAQELRLLQASDHVVVITDDFFKRIGPAGWGIPADRIEVIENWAPLEDFPLLPGESDWSARNFRPGRRRIVYAGTLARKHDPEVLVQLALRLDVDIHLFSVGRGPDQVARRAAELRLDNLFVRHWAGPDDFPSALAGADLACAFIDADAAAYSVPSKVLSYLAAGRPVLAGIPRDNLAARILLEAEAGLVSEPGDGEAMLRHAEALLASPELCRRLGHNGRAYAEAHFDIERISRRFEAVVAAAERDAVETAPLFRRERAGTAAAEA